MKGAAVPLVGQVVDHAFLWVEESRAGLEEGRKARPCLIIAVEPTVDRESPRVTLLPFTTRPPRDGGHAIAVPDRVKHLMGLDGDRAVWLVLDDANMFVWPGFDLVPQADGGFIRGQVTSGFFQQVRSALLALRSRGRPRHVPRD